MARGDIVTVAYAGPSGTEKEVVKATLIGSKVEITEPRTNEQYLVVSELNKAGQPVRTARFSKSAVLSVVEGREGPQKRGKK